MVSEILGKRGRSPVHATDAKKTKGDNNEEDEEEMEEDEGEEK